MSTHPVTSRPVDSGQRAAAGRKRIGFLRPGHIENAFIAALYLALLVLVVLSFLGTFYWLLGSDAPLSEPLTIVGDVLAAPRVFGIACAIQFALMLAQWGARQFARRDRRWWLIYLAALGFSVYYNIQAYYAPLVALGVAGWVSAAIIVAGDIVPEVTAVRHT
jgi:hypothetical protein